MEEKATFTFSGFNRNNLIGKVVLILIFGCVTGYAFTKNKASDFVEGNEITLEQYIEGFEAHKADLKKLNPRPSLGILLFTVGTVVFFGAYEILGRLLGSALGKIIETFKHLGTRG
jgi:hypothetical protein